jgi:4-amino-4-deoxy-L-arabinose transferase-like glycosyltransferase
MQLTFPRDRLQPPGFSRVAAERLLLAAVIVIAFFMRFYRLDQIPRGVLLDESFNGIDVLRILGGDRPIFLPANNGREALFIYLQAVGVSVFGQTDWALRVPSAIVGFLTLPASYLLLRRLYRSRVAVLACGWLAVSLWHVMYSRIGLRTILLPLVCSGAFYLLWRGLDALDSTAKVLASDPQSMSDDAAPVATPHRTTSLPWFAAAGALLGLAQYTYTTARFAPLVVLAFGGYLAITNAPAFRRAFFGLVVTALVASAVFAPEGLYFLRHPDAFSTRADEVSVFNASLNRGDVVGALEYSTARSLGMFFYRGDEQWDRNIPGRPIFDPFSSVIAALGVLVAARRAREPKIAFTILWIVVMLVPSAIAIRNVPNFVRVTGLIPAIYALPALGAHWLWQQWDRRAPSRLALTPFAIAGAALLVGSSLTYRDYFQYWARQIPVSQTFGADVWIAIDAARRLVPTATTPLYVGAGDRDEPVPRFDLMGDGRSDGFAVFDGQQTLILPPSGQPASYIFPARYLPAASLRQQFFPDGSGRVVALAPDGEAVARYDLPGVPDPLKPERQISARLGVDFELYGFDVPSDVRAGDDLTIRAFWKLLTPDTRTIYFFGQLLDAAGERRNQDDERVVSPAYWPPGTRGVSILHFRVDPSLPTGVYSIIAGAYDRSSLQRLPVIDGAGRESGTQLTVGLVKVHGGQAPRPDVPSHQHAKFGDGIELLGSDVAPTQARPGDKLKVTLFWAAHGRPSADYTVFVHLLDGQGRLQASGDAPPVTGKYPTSLWDDGEVIADPHEVPIDASTLPGNYLIEVGLYLPRDGRRLPVLDANEGVVGDRLLLQDVRVEVR